jgi:hypothetical protein
MNTIKQRAHKYAVAHQHKADGISLMRAYVAGAQSERKRTKVFISGKVTGIEYYVAYQTFANADRQLSSMGYQVINPMKICRKNWSWLRCMAKCLWAIYFCDKIYQLPNWQESRGARIEYRWAKLLRKRIL